MLVYLEDTRLLHRRQRGSTHGPHLVILAHHEKHKTEKPEEKERESETHSCEGQRLNESIITTFGFALQSA